MGARLGLVNLVILILEIYQSKSGILTKQLMNEANYESSFWKDDIPEEYLKVCLREKDSKDDTQKEVGTGDNYNKKDESNIFYGTHETQESEGGESDLDTHFLNCKKNPGHSEFVSVNDFNINNLPKGLRKNDIVEYIKATASLTVRVGVQMTSTERPDFLPNTTHPYPFYDKRGSDVMRLGTGMVWIVNKWTEEVIKKYNLETCNCHNCQHSDTPSKAWGQVKMYTARHVVFDDLEARHTTCRLFYDRPDSPLVSLNGWTVHDANIEEDWCVLKYVTCDVDLLDQLDKMSEHWYNLMNKVSLKYKSSRDTDKLTFIVSHPHGCPKQISVGHWIDRFKVNENDETKYTYTTCTCPGSSGAQVHPLGYNGWCYDLHLHSGVNSEQINFSGTGRYLF